MPLTAGSLWAKIERNPDGQVIGWHSLIDHSADVAAVIEALLAQPTLNRRLARTAGLTEFDDTACARLAALAFLHDIGKGNRGFRARVDPKAPMVGHIDQLAWLLREDNADDLGERLVNELRLQPIINWFDSTPDGEIWDAGLLTHSVSPPSSART